MSAIINPFEVTLKANGPVENCDCTCYIKGIDTSTGQFHDDDFHMPSSKLFKQLSAKSATFIDNFDDLSGEMRLTIINNVSGDMDFKLTNSIKDVNGNVDQQIEIVNNAMGNFNSTINNSIEKISGNVTANTENIENIKGEIVTVNNNINSKISEISGDVFNKNEIQTELTTLSASLKGNIDSDLDAIRGTIINENTINSKIEAGNNSMISNMNNISSEILAMLKDVDDAKVSITNFNNLDSTVKQINENVGSVSAAIFNENGITSQITQINKDVDDVKAYIENNDEIIQSVQSINENVKNLDLEIDAMNARINQELILSIDNVINAQVDVGGQIAQINQTIELSISNVETLTLSVGDQIADIRQELSTSIISCGDVIISYGDQIAALNQRVTQNATNIDTLSTDFGDQRTLIEQNQESINERINNLTETFGDQIADINQSMIEHASESQTVHTEFGNQVARIEQAQTSIIDNVEQFKIEHGTQIAEINQSMDNIINNVSEISGYVSSMYRYCGSCTYDDLEKKISTARPGDVWDIIDRDYENYAFVAQGNGGYWDSLGKEFDLARYAQLGVSSDTIDTLSLHGVKNLATQIKRDVVGLSSDPTTTKTLNGISNRITSLNRSDAAVANQVVSTVSEAGGLITVGRRALTKTDIPTTLRGTTFENAVTVSSGGANITGGATIAGSANITGGATIAGGANITGDVTFNNHVSLPASLNIRKPDNGVAGKGGEICLEKQSNSYYDIRMDNYGNKFRLWHQNASNALVGHIFQYTPGTGELKGVTSLPDFTAPTAGSLNCGTVGLSTRPVFFQNGLPVVCGTDLAVNVSGMAGGANWAYNDQYGQNIANTYMGRTVIANYFASPQNYDACVTLYLSDSAALSGASNPFADTYGKYKWSQSFYAGGRAYSAYLQFENGSTDGDDNTYGVALLLNTGLVSSSLGQLVTTVNPRYFKSCSITSNRGWARIGQFYGLVRAGGAQTQYLEAYSQVKGWEDSNYTDHAYLYIKWLS